MAYGHEDKCPHPGYPCTCKCAPTPTFTGRVTVAVTDEMVERARKVLDDHRSYPRAETIRAALEAALNK